MAASFGMLKSWGYEGRPVGLAVTVTSIWNQLMILGVPIVAVAMLVAQGDPGGAARWTQENGLGPDDEPDYAREPGHLVLARVLLAQGRSNLEIAQALFLSPYTVQDHTKSLFEKTGVSSRQELVARIFLEDYMPRLAQHEPLSATGRFA